MRGFIAEMLQGLRMPVRGEVPAETAETAPATTAATIPPGSRRDTTTGSTADIPLALLHNRQPLPTAKGRGYLLQNHSTCRVSVAFGNHNVVADAHSAIVLSPFQAVIATPDGSPSHVSACPVGSIDATLGTLRGPVAGAVEVTRLRPLCSECGQ